MQAFQFRERKCCKYQFVKIITCYLITTLLNGISNSNDAYDALHEVRHIDSSMKSIEIQTWEKVNGSDTSCNNNKLGYKEDYTFYQLLKSLCILIKLE